MPTISFQSYLRSKHYGGRGQGSSSVLCLQFVRQRPCLPHEFPFMLTQQTLQHSVALHQSFLHFPMPGLVMHMVSFIWVSPGKKMVGCRRSHLSMDSHSFKGNSCGCSFASQWPMGVNFYVSNFLVRDSRRPSLAPWGWRKGRAITSLI